MKWLFAALIILVITVSLALWAYQDPGYVIFARGHKTAELSLSLFVLIVVFVMVLAYVSVRLLITGLNMPYAFRSWRQKQKINRARRDSNKGLIELAQGHWAQAERYLLRSVKDSEMPLLNYLSAARAAQKQGASERRDNYLGLAHKSMQGSEFAVQLTQAELQLVHGQLEQSLATLVQLHTKTPKHPHVLYLLARSYELLRSWGDLKTLLPELRKQHVLSEDKLNVLEKRVHRELTTIATQQGKIEALKNAWQQIPKKLRHDIEMVHHYVLCLLTIDSHDEAETIIRDSMKRQWNNQLVYLYGNVNSSNADKQLATAETWLKGNEKNPVLLLTLGRLCMRNQLWGKARSYLEASIGIQPRSDSYKELGQLMEQLEEPVKAAKYFRQGLLLAAEEKLDDMLSVVPSQLPLLPAAI